MKTQKSYTAILLLLALLFAVALQASTTPISESMGSINSPLENKGNSNIAPPSEDIEFYFEDEEYVNDIPFDTECISKLCKYNKAISLVFNMEDETYVEDIPFDTENILENSLMEKALEVEFNLDDEAYVDDIPFDTYAVVKNYNYKEQFAHYE